MNLRKIVFLVVLALFAVESYAQLPSVTLKDMNGKTIETGKLDNDGKPFIISFFATWCKPCFRELNAIHDLYPDWQDETGVKVVVVSIDEGQNIQKVKPIADSYSWDYDVLLDPNGDFKRAMNVVNIPAVFVIDGNGDVAYSHTGYTEGSEEILIEKVRELLQN